MQSDTSLVVELLDDGASSPRSTPVSEALAVALARGARLNEGHEGFQVSFTSLLLGLLAAPDATGEWLRSRREAYAVGLDGLLRERGLDWPALQRRAVADDRDEALRFVVSAAPLRVTSSAGQALDDAARCAGAEGRPPGTADVLEAMLTRPDFHDADFKRYGIDRFAWAEAFAAASRRGDAVTGSTAAPPPSSQSAADGMFDPSAAGVEQHVRLALQHAAGLAGGDPVEPGHVIAAVGQIAADVGSSAFTRLAQLVPLLPTPRIAKRLVNVYRVLKAAKSVEELDRFEREERVRPCLLMLAILFGRPAVAGELLRGLHDGRKPFDDRGASLAAAIRNRVPGPDESAAVRMAWSRLAQTLDQIGAAGIDATVGQCAREALKVARYSLVTGHDWHTWGSSPKAPPAGH